MANITPLTAKLQTFKNTVSTSISSMETAKNEIANYLNEALTSYESAYNGITSAITDNQGKAAAQSLALVKQAVEVMKNSITNDMGNILSECKKVSEEITRIEKEIERGNKLSPGAWERFWNEVVGFFTSKWCDNDAGEIKRINEDVEQSMRALEAQLDAIANGSNSVKLGIIGNMVAGGTLGSYIDFTSSYNFNLQQWKTENPVYHANLLGKAGCFVVGQVEGAIKFFEGAVDAVLIAGATVVQGVGCIFGQDWSQNILSNAAKFDVANAITGVAYDALKFVGQYDEGWRTAGNVVGQVTAVVTVGAVLSPAAAYYLSIATAGGQAGEASLKAGNSSLIAFGTGAVAAGVAWATGGIMQKAIGTAPVQNVISKTGQWLTSGSNTANLLNTAGKFVGKAANVITRPAQATTKGIIKAGEAIGTRVGPAVSAIGNKLVQGTKNLYNRITNRGSSTGGSPTGGSLTGGSPTGGSPTGGSPTGGSPTGGSLTGGSPTGGSPTGGSPTGGSPTGGSPTGGSPTGGSSTGGSLTGGSPTGGSPTGGSPTGGSPTGGSPTGGSPTGGSSTGGSPTGGSPTGGSSKVTADNSMFGSISDSEFRAYQARNGIEVPTDELLKRVGITSDMDPFQMDILVTNAAKKRIINAAEGNLLKNYFGIQI